MQFVPFNKFRGDAEELAAAVLEELPAQVSSFYRMIGKAPNPPPEKAEVQTSSKIHLLELNSPEQGDGDRKSSSNINYPKPPPK